MATTKSAPARPVIQYGKLDLRERLERIAQGDCLSCDHCDEGLTLKLLAQDLLKIQKAHEKRERRIRAARRRGNLIMFPKLP